MLEVPKTKLERLAPIVIAGIVLIGLAGFGLSAAWPAIRRALAAPDNTAATVGAPSPSPTAEVEQARPTDTAPRDEWIEWSGDGGISTYRIAGFTLTFSSVPRDGLTAARATIVAPNGETTSIEGDAAFGTPRADFAVVQLDASSSAHQILFSTFSGGAHCCTTLTILNHEGSGWTRTEAGSWDGGTPRLPYDLDGDGRLEFVVRDQAFLYAFAPYAMSWAPPVVLSWDGDRVRDVSSDRRYRTVYEGELSRVRDACGEYANGACAAYVATAARLGRLDEAWSFMLRSYDQQDGWATPTGCRVRTSSACPAGAEARFQTYPEALQWFLGEHRYTEPSYLAPLNATGPSFACGAARLESERLICASARLSELDRLMATLYTRAMALTPNRAALRASQRDFLRGRDALSDPTSLAMAYEGRIRELSVI